MIKWLRVRVWLTGGGVGGIGVVVCVVFVDFCVFVFCVCMSGDGRRDVCVLGYLCFCLFVFLCIMYFCLCHVRECYFFYF